MNNNHGLTNTGTSNSGNNNSNRNINSNGRDTHDDNFSQFSGHGNSQSNGNNKNKNSNGYDDNISQFSGHESTQTNTGSNADRGTSNINNNDKNHPPVMVSTSSQTNGNQGRDIYNYNQVRERSTSGYDFVADSLAGSSNSGGNHNSAVTQRPFSLQTTTDYNYHGDRRPTTSSYRPVRDSTTKKSTYFQGDLPFFNHDGNDETSVSLLKVSSSSLINKSIFSRLIQFLISMATRNAELSYLKSILLSFMAKKLIRDNFRGTPLCTYRKLEVLNTFVVVRSSR